MDLRSRETTDLSEFDHVRLSHASAGSALHTLPAPGAPRILIADGHELTRMALACLLERKGYEVAGLAGSGPEAVSLWRQLAPDLALLDLRLPQLDGIAASQAIRAKDPGARVVVLSIFDSDESIGRAFSAGVGGYILKTASLQTLCKCLDTVRAGRRFLCPEMAPRMDLHQAGLSARELEVLAGVAQGLRNKHIARSLDVAESTVKAHLKSIMSKLRAGSRTHAAAIAIRRGLVEL